MLLIESTGTVGPYGETVDVFITHSESSGYNCTIRFYETDNSKRDQLLPAGREICSIHLNKEDRAELKAYL